MVRRSARRDQKTVPPLVNREKYPSILRICESVVAVWPNHHDFISTRFDDPFEDSLLIAEEIAGLALRLADKDLSTFASAYRWMCEEFLVEELYFRRNGKYRLSSFEDAYRAVYSRPDYMRKYLQGILISQVLWKNQTKAFHFYVERFLKRLGPRADFLEVGPGHGLLIYFAARDINQGSLSAWDVSNSSLEMTKNSLKTLKVRRPVSMACKNIMEPISKDESFDALVMSEVLEHVDRPEIALRQGFRSLRYGGLAFFNIPINSPAPDHIFNWDSPEQIVDLIRSAGFVIVDSDNAPVTGYTFDRAMKRKVTVNCLIVARRG